MNPLEEQVAELKGEGTDIQAAALVSALMNLEAIAEDVLFEPLGDFARNYAMEVAKVHPPYSTAMQQEKTVVQMHRASIYDGLPEGLFHQSEDHKPFRDAAELQAMIQANNEKEAEARKFFLPFDHELMVARAGIAKNESSQIQNVVSASQLRGLKKFWSLPRFLSGQSQGRMLMLLPLAHAIRNDIQLLEQATALIIDQPVSICKTFEPIRTPYPHSQPFDGMVLGVNSLLGDEHEEVQSVLHFTIGPLSKGQAADYSPGGRSLRKLNLIFEVFVPCNMVCDWDVVIEDQERFTEPGSEETRLGITTFLMEA